MTTDHRRSDAHTAQEILLDDPAFLREIVEGVVRIFPDRQACLRLVTALAVERSEERLTGRRYLDMRELEEQRRRGEQGAEEVALMERYGRDQAWRKLQKLRDLT